MILVIKLEDVQNDGVNNYTYYIGEQPQGSDKHVHPHAVSSDPPLPPLPHTHSKVVRQYQGDKLGTGISSLPIIISVQCISGFDSLLSTHIDSIL